MAINKFNPLDYGATPVQEFNPLNYGAIPIQETSEEIQKPSLFSQIGKRFKERTNLGAEAILRKQAPIETGLQLTGQAAGFAGDILGETLSATGRALPEFIKKPITKTAQQALAQFAQTSVGKTGIEALSSGIDAYRQWKSQNPRSAANLEASFNIASLLPTEKVASLAFKPTAKLAEETGQALIRSGVEKAALTKTNFLRELSRPERTAAVKAAEVARTTETGFGPFKRSIVRPTIPEQKSIEALKEVPGIQSRYTYQRNYNIIQDYNLKEAERLKNSIINRDFIYPKQEFKTALSALKQKLAKEPELVGDTLKTAEKLVAKFETFIDEQPGKGSGLLQARKNYDAFVKSRKGEKIFDPKTENAFSVVNREVRGLANNFLDKNAPSLQIKTSLKRQSALFNALDNIESKAAKEADTAFMRSLQRIGDILGTKSRIVQGIAAAVGIGGLGAAATFAKPVAIAGLGGWLVYKAGKLILRPEVRIGLGTALSALNKEIGILSASTIAGVVPKIKEIKNIQQDINSLLQKYD